MSCGVLVVGHGGKNSKSNEVAELHANRLMNNYDLDVDEIKVASIVKKNIREKIDEMSSEKIYSF